MSRGGWKRRVAESCGGGMAGGLRIIIARSAFFEVYEPAWCRALNEIGVRCRIFDTHALMPGGLFGRIERKFMWGPGIWRANRRLEREVRAERPDVVLFYQGNHFYRETIEKIRRSTFVAGYHNDDPMGPRRRSFRYRHMLKALPLYHGYHVYRECNVTEFLAAGVPRVRLLMSYYTPWLDFPRELGGDAARRWASDVVFAGHPEPDMRIECLAGAARAGLRARVYGDYRYWGKWTPPDALALLSPGPPLIGEDYRMAICGAKVCACFFSRWNRDQYTRRVFEIPACGAFLLAERTPVMLGLYEEGKEAEYFSSVEEFVDKARFYVENDEARKRIAGAGYKRCMSSGYDVYSRMRQWLKDIEEWRGS